MVCWHHSSRVHKLLLLYIDRLFLLLGPSELTEGLGGLCSIVSCTTHGGSRHTLRLNLVPGDDSDNHACVKCLMNERLITFLDGSRVDPRHQIKLRRSHDVGAGEIAAVVLSTSVDFMWHDLLNDHRLYVITIVEASSVKVQINCFVFRSIIYHIIVPVLLDLLTDLAHVVFRLVLIIVVLISTPFLNVFSFLHFLGSSGDRVLGRS